MSLLIRGMEMPTSCAECRFYGEYCYAKGDENKYSKLPCPLIPVPPHGDLIERSAANLTDFEIAMCGGNFKEGMKMLLEKLENAPTILPADHIGDVNEMVTDKEDEG